MRNLREYPITRDEKIRALERAIRETAERWEELQREGKLPVGDIHLAALTELLKDLRRG